MSDIEVEVVTNEAPKAETKEVLAENAEEVQQDSEETLDSNESEESEESEQVEETAEEKPKKKGGFQKRIDKLNNRLSEKDRMIAELQAEIQKKSIKDEPKKVDSSDKPMSQNFDTIEEYTEALTEWKAKKIIAEEREKESKSKEQLKAQEKYQSFQKKTETFAKAVPDFDQVLDEADHVPLSKSLHDIFLTSENGPELMYELAKNVDEYERINSLSAIEQAREIGKFEAKLVKQEKQITKTNAPKPLKPLGSKTTVVKSPDEMTQEEFNAWRESTKRRA